jgi:hypothetical protein
MRTGTFHEKQGPASSRNDPARASLAAHGSLLLDPVNQVILGWLASPAPVHAQWEK